MQVQKITKSQFKVSEWSGGKTEEIFIYPPDAQYCERNFSVRISTATVDLERSDFTDLPGVHRLISPLNGTIRLEERETHRVLVELQPFEVFRFSGDTPITSFGRCRDFNVMTKGAFSSGLHPLISGSQTVLPQGTFAFAFSTSGAGTIQVGEKNYEMTAFDFLLFSSVPAPLSIRNNTAETILVGSIG